MELVRELNDQIQPETMSDQEGKTEKGGSTVIEATSWFSRATLDILGISVFGHDFSAIKDPSCPLNTASSTYRTASKTQKKVLILRYFLSQHLPGWVTQCMPFFRYDEIEKTMQPPRHILKGIVQERKCKLQNQEIQETDVLSLALASKRFSEDGIVDQMMNLYHAGLV